MEVDGMGRQGNGIIDLFDIIYYSNFEKHKCTYFHWDQCNEPTTLTLGNLRCFSLISTQFAVVIATAFSYRFKCLSHNGWPRAFLLTGKLKIWVFTEICIILKW